MSVESIAKQSFVIVDAKSSDVPDEVEEKKVAVDSTSSNSTSSVDDEDTDSGDGSDGVEESDYASDLATAQSNQVVSTLINLVSRNLLNITSIEALENEWVRANSSENSDGVNLFAPRDSVAFADTSLRDNSQWWTEYHGESMFSALVSSGNQNHFGLMPTAGGDFQLEHGYFQV